MPPGLAGAHMELVPTSSLRALPSQGQPRIWRLRCALSFPSPESASSESQLAAWDPQSSCRTKKTEGPGKGPLQLSPSNPQHAFYYWHQAIPRFQCPLTVLSQLASGRRSLMCLCGCSRFFLACRPYSKLRNTFFSFLLCPRECGCGAMATIGFPACPDGRVGDPLQ